MGKIKILDEHTRLRISAGEVVDRPASVVKELVENSIDAGSREVLIEIKKAGKSYIRVVDNGEGMDEEDLALCVQRYATSKIQQLEDIFRINTLGFRGEALAAIASISWMEIRTRRREDEVGNYIKVEAGVIKGRGKIQMPWGTEIIVRNLFFNTPARRKFLKSDATEYNHILDTAFKLGLAFPEIQIQFLSGDKKILDLRRSGYEERIEQLFPELKGSLIRIESRTPIFNLTGFLSPPEINYPRRIRQYTFVNRRPVVSGLLYAIVDKVYQGVMETRRYPAVFLFLEIPPHLIDVNIHPTKREIKFRNEQEIYKLLLNILQDELRGEKVVKVLRPGKEEKSPAGKFYHPQVASSSGEMSGYEIREIQHTFITRGQEEYLIYNNKYVIWIDEEGINIVDHHAGWEKVLYEKIKKALESAEIETQRLLLPEVINLDAHRAEILRQNINLFLNLGFDIREFGENSFIIHACPQFVKKGARELIAEIIADIIAEDKPGDKTHKIVASLACHSAVRAGDRLSREEVEELISAVKNLTLPYCPHGRPAWIKIKWQDIEREMGRR